MLLYLHLILLALVVSFVPNKVLAQDIQINELLQNYNYSDVYRILDDVKKLYKVPDYSNLQNFEGTVVLIEPHKLPNLKSITDTFYDVQNNFFRRKIVALMYCTIESDCGFSAEFPIKQIFFQIELVEKIMNDKSYKNPLNVLRYISAHELAHYVQEISAHPPYSTEPGLSFHGNMSPYQDVFSIFVESLDEKERIAMSDGTSKIAREFERNYTLKAHRGHAEVDMIAIIVLQRSGFKDWDDIILFFQKTIEEEKQIDSEDQKSIVLDFENRLRATKKVLKEIQ